MSAISYQQSAISYQQSAISSQLLDACLGVVEGDFSVALRHVQPLTV